MVTYGFLMPAVRRSWHPLEKWWQSGSFTRISGGSVWFRICAFQSVLWQGWRGGSPLCCKCNCQTRKKGWAEAWLSKDPWTVCLVSLQETLTLDWSGDLAEISRGCGLGLWKDKEVRIHFHTLSIILVQATACSSYSTMMVRRETAFKQCLIAYAMHCLNSCKPSGPLVDYIGRRCLQSKSLIALLKLHVLLSFDQGKGNLQGALLSFSPRKHSLCTSEATSPLDVIRQLEEREIAPTGWGKFMTSPEKKVFKTNCKIIWTLLKVRNAAPGRISHPVPLTLSNEEPCQPCLFGNGLDWNLCTPTVAQKCHEAWLL